MLGKSCDQLPYNIVFVLDDDEGSPDEVIGHSRLCRVHGQESHASWSQVWILDSDLLIFVMHNFQYYIEKEKYHTFQSLSCAWSTSFRGLHIHLVRLTLATAPMTSNKFQTLPFCYLRL